jgi:cysteine desulfurase
MKEIYLDFAAATPIDSRVLKAMNEAARLYANPSSFNDAGRKARETIEESRTKIGNFLGARADEIIFTSSGSEANQLALNATLAGLKGNVITSPIEHTSIRQAFQRLSLEIKTVPVDGMGFVDPKSVERLLNKECRMVSIMYANNEIGVIEPIQKISKIISAYNRKHGTQILFHVDSCQAALFLDMNVRHLGIDLLTFDGTKIYGPHGIGILFIKRGTDIRQSRGWAGQEKGLKTGTENIQAIVGLAKAVSLINRTKEQKIHRLRDYALQKLIQIPDLRVNGPVGQDRLPNNINVCIKGLDSEQLLLELDKQGIRAGSGSACTSHSVEPSYVLEAIGVPAEYIHGALRFSFGHETKKQEIDYLVNKLSRIVGQLRKRYARVI